MEKVTKITIDPKEKVLEPTPLNSSAFRASMLPKNENAKNKLYIFLGLLVAVICLGSGTGFVLAKKLTTTSGGNNSVGVQNSNSVQTQNEVGINDDTAFPDSATGILATNGVRGEGTHHLDRSASNEKEVALSSTIINLDNFVGKKVEVRGQTISSKTSGWLMDVGKVKIVQ